MRLTILLLSFFFISAANSQESPDTDAEYLRTQCKSLIEFMDSDQGFDNTESAFNGGYCFGLLHGMAMFYTVGSAIGKDESTPDLFCFPDNVSFAQMAWVYVKWADNHPERLHEGSLKSLGAAMSNAFPCKGTNKKE